MFGGENGDGCNVCCPGLSVLDNGENGGCNVCSEFCVPELISSGNELTGELWSGCCVLVALLRPVSAEEFILTSDGGSCDVGPTFVELESTTGREEINSESWAGCCVFAGLPRLSLVAEGGSIAGDVCSSPVRLFGGINDNGCNVCCPGLSVLDNGENGGCNVCSE